LIPGIPVTDMVYLRFTRTLYTHNDLIVTYDHYSSMDDWLLFGYVFKRAIRMPPQFP
jgi:hypothetical protein